MSSGRWSDLWFTALRKSKVWSYFPTWAPIFLLWCIVHMYVSSGWVSSHGGTVKLCIGENQAVHLKMVAASKHTLTLFSLSHLLLFTLIAQKTHTWIQWASEWHHLESALLSSAIMYGFSFLSQELSVGLLVKLWWHFTQWLRVVYYWSLKLFLSPPGLRDVRLATESD